MFIALTSFSGTFACFKLDKGSMHGLNGFKRLKTKWLFFWRSWKYPKWFNIVYRRALDSPLNLNGLAMDITCM